jgi:hypothetical protein
MSREVNTEPIKKIPSSKKKGGKPHQYEFFSRTFYLMPGAEVEHSRDSTSGAKAAGAPQEEKIAGRRLIAARVEQRIEAGKLVGIHRIG